VSDQEQPPSREMRVHQEPPPSNPGEPDQVREAYDALQDKSGKDR